MTCTPPRRNDQPRSRPRARRRPRAGPFRPARHLTITALAAGTLIASRAPVTGAAGAAERSAPPAAINGAACGTRLECARVSVPLDWARHGGRVITLSVIRHLASPPGQLGRYFTGLATPARGTTCPSDRGPFDPGSGQPAASR